MIWGLNFGKANLTAAYLSAQSILKAFASPAVKSAGIMLDGIEIGNEADLYAYNGLRQSTYTVLDYVNEYAASILIIQSDDSNFLDGQPLQETSQSPFPWRLPEPDCGLLLLLILLPRL